MLPGQLGLPIDGGGILGRVFRHGFDGGRAVQGDGAHEEKPLHPAGHRRIKQHLRGTEIDLKRQRRILFAHARHKRAEMEDPLDAVGRHRSVQIEIRSAVALHVGDRIHNVLQQMRNRNTVENDDFVALPQQSADKMGTDEARSARYENTHETSPGMPHG